MGKYLLSLIGLLLVSFAMVIYMLVNVDPFSTITVSIPLIIVGIFFLVFAFVTLFLFFLAEIWNKANSTEYFLKKSARRGLIFALFSITLLSLQLFRWFDLLLAIGIFFLFLFIEIYFSFLNKKNATF